MAARDVILIGAIFFVLAAGIFALYYGATTAFQKLVEIPSFNESSHAVAAVQAASNQLNKMDMLLFAVFVGLMMSLIAVSWFIAGNAIFSFLFMIAVTVGVVLSAVLANAWEAFSQATVFGTTVSHFVITNYIMLHLPIFVAIAGMVCLIILFGKPAAAGGE